MDTSTGWQLCREAGTGPWQTPSYLAGFFSPWKSVSGLSLEAACMDVMDGTRFQQVPPPGMS